MMKVILCNPTGFAELDMPLIPIKGDTLFFEGVSYEVQEVEWVIENNHVNLVLWEI